MFVFVVIHLHIGHLPLLAPYTRGFGYNHRMADDVFDVFTTHIATPDRPLYFHTDETSLRGLFIYLQDKLGKKPTILPWRVRHACHEPWLAQSLSSHIHDSHCDAAAAAAC